MKIFYPPIIIFSILFIVFGIVAICDGLQHLSKQAEPQPVYREHESNPTLDAMRRY